MPTVGSEPLAELLAELQLAAVIDTTTRQTSTRHGFGIESARSRPAVLIEGAGDVGADPLLA